MVEQFCSEFCTIANASDKAQFLQALGDINWTDASLYDFMAGLLDEDKEVLIAALDQFAVVSEVLTKES
jgi:hypothetical protein